MTKRDRITGPDAAPIRWQWKLGRWLMIVAALVYGPLPSLIDLFDPYHLTNPEWNGHARLHLLWLIAICASAGLCAAYLAWRASPERPETLEKATLLGLIIVGSFFCAGIFGPLVGANYGPPEHYFFGGRVGGPLIHFTLAGLFLGSGILLTRAGVRARGEVTDHG